MGPQTIKVADLLHHIGSTDQITLHNISLEEINLHHEHLIQGYLNLQSMSAERIGATLRDIECGIISTCDHCGNEFIRPIWVDAYECTFTMDSHDSNTDDEGFPIDEKENIHIDEPLRQAILLNQPVTIHCLDCINKNTQEKGLMIDEIDDTESSSTGGTIIFR